MHGAHFEVLLPALRRRRWMLGLAISAGILAQAIGVALPLLVRAFVQEHDAGAAPTGARGPSPLLVAALVLLLLAGAQGVLRWWRAQLGERLAQGVLADVRTRMYAHLQGLAQGYYDRRPAGRIVVRFVGDASALRTWIARTIVGMPADAATVAGVALAVASIEPRLLLVAALPLTLLVPVQLFLAPRARRLTRQGRTWQARLCGFLGERLAAMNAIQAANAQAPDRDEATRMIAGIEIANVARGRLDAWSQALSLAATTAALGAVGLYGAWLHDAGALGQADLLATVWLLLLIRGPIQRLAQASVIHQRVRVATERIAALLERRAEASSPRQEPYSGPGSSVILRRLSYRDRHGEWLLRGVSAHVSGPDLLLVRGGSERARSALLELLLRVRRPHEGRIRLDGRDVRRLRVHDVRASMGWIDRERRVAEVAIAWTPGGLAASPGLAAARAAAAILAPPTEEESPATLDALRRATPAARLHLAAVVALLRDPPILLVDEPTLGLGEEEAEAAREWCLAMARTRLVVVASADPSLLPLAGQVLDLGAREVANGSAAPRAALDGVLWIGSTP